MSLAMSTAEREAFLADVHVAVISIPEPGRGGLVIPIWYDYAPGVHHTHAFDRLRQVLSPHWRV